MSTDIRLIYNVPILNSMTQLREVKQSWPANDLWMNDLGPTWEGGGDEGNDKAPCDG
jgi:hypothetical protein